MSEDNSMVVLLVEDDSMLRDIFYEEFLSLGFDVLLAENGKIALEILKDHSVDFILTDVVMPVMTGMEFLIAAKSVTTNLPPIFVMTGGSPYTEQQFYDAGAAGYFEKVKFRPSMVLSLLRKSS